MTFVGFQIRVTCYFHAQTMVILLSGRYQTPKLNCKLICFYNTIDEPTVMLIDLASADFSMQNSFLIIIVYGVLKNKNK